MIRKTVYILGMFVFVAAGAAYAQRPEGAWSDKDPQMAADIAAGEKAANVTPEQREKMKALRTEFKARQKGIWEQIKAKREALRQELDSPSPDRAKANALAADINSLQGQAALNRVDEVFKVRGILSAEQYQKLKAFHEKNKEKFRARMKEHFKDRGKGDKGDWRGPDDFHRGM